jgi:DNA mismatch repair ATPase MutS
MITQLETAAEKKVLDGGKSSTIFERRLTSIYTAATLMGDDIKHGDVERDSPSGVAQTIVAIVDVGTTPLSLKSGKTCMACVQPLTGEVVFDEFPSKMLEQRLALIQPLEILVPAKSEKKDELLLNSQRETILRYVQERNSLTGIPVRLEELSKDRFNVDKFQDALYSQTENIDCGFSLRQIWPSFGLDLCRFVVYVTTIWLVKLTYYKNVIFRRFFDLFFIFESFTRICTSS